MKKELKLHVNLLMQRQIISIEIYAITTAEEKNFQNL